jgi:Family of unknown function (DUF6172)
MKKTYPLIVEGKNADRVLEAVKHDIRKYFKRCRAAQLPKDVDFWDFDCAVGADATNTTAVHPSSVVTQVDVVAKEGHASVYVVVEAKHGMRSFVQREAQSGDQPGDQLNDESSEH